MLSKLYFALPSVASRVRNLFGPPSYIGYPIENWQDPALEAGLKFLSYAGAIDKQGHAGLIRTPALRMRRAANHPATR